MNSLTTLRPSLVGKLNERQILRVIQAHGPLSRAEVVRQSGLSAPTVSKAVASLLGAGLLEETAAPGPSRGRPAPKIRLATESVQIIGVVVDAGHCEVVSAGLDGVLHSPTPITVPTPTQYPDLIEHLAKACRGLMARTGVTTLGLGMSLPGLIDYRKGQGVLSPNLPMTNGHCPAADLGRELGIDTVLLHEPDALCLAERHYGQAVGLDDYAMLDIGTGVGLGVMSGGRLIRGRSGLAGELGHITVVTDSSARPCGCGNVGCLETVASDWAFAQRVSERLGRPVSVDEAITLIQTGRAPLSKELQESVRYMAVAAAAVINLFNPATVFVHSPLFAADAMLFDRLVELTRQRSLPPSFADCRIVQARGNKRQGAVAGVIHHLTNAVVPGLESI